MKIQEFTENLREDWNAFVAREPFFALFQSWEWGEFKEVLGWRAHRVAVVDQGRILAGAQILIKPIPPGLVSVAYIPRGPVGDWLNMGITTLLLHELHRIARSYRAIYLHIEPPLLHDSIFAQVLEHHHFQSSSYINLAHATIILDLTQGLEELLVRMSQKTRYNIRYAAKKGVTVRVGDLEDLPTFYRLITITGSRGGFVTRSLDYYLNQWKLLAERGHVRLFIASYQGKAIAANMSAVFGRHAAYLHGASSGEHVNLQPNYLLIWETLQWARAQNCDTFDLWGIPVEVGLSVNKGDGLPVTDSTDDLWGVYRFKRGFSKNVVLFAGAFDYVYMAPFYALISNKFVSSNALDQIDVWIHFLTRKRQKLLKMRDID